MIGVEKIKEGLRGCLAMGTELHTENFGGTSVQFADLNAESAVNEILQFLTDEGLGFADKDAGLPPARYPDTETDAYCWEAQLDMEQAGFKKFIPLKDLLDG